MKRLCSSRNAFVSRPAGRALLPSIVVAGYSASRRHRILWRRFTLNQQLRLATVEFPKIKREAIGRRRPSILRIHQDHYRHDLQGSWLGLPPWALSDEQSVAPPPRSSYPEQHKTDMLLQSALPSTLQAERYSLRQV